MAITVNVAGNPAETVVFVGCTVMIGVYFTVSRALELQTVPAALLTTTLNNLPLSLAVVTAVVTAAPVAPLMYRPLVCH